MTDHVSANPSNQPTNPPTKPPFFQVTITRETGKRRTRPKKKNQKKKSEWPRPAGTIFNTSTHAPFTTAAPASNSLGRLAASTETLKSQINSPCAPAAGDHEATTATSSSVPRRFCSRWRLHPCPAAAAAASLVMAFFIACEPAGCSSGRELLSVKTPV